CPSLAAVSVAVPTAIAVTSPDVFTVATAGALDAQLTARPDSSLPFASFRIATNCRAPLTITVALGGVTRREATGAVDPAVVTTATFDNPPNTAFALSVPRRATSSKLVDVPAARPSTVQVRRAPTVAPITGVAQVPRVTMEARPHETAPAAYRTSYSAG